MGAKKKVGLLATLCLLGTSFAWGGFGMDFGWGNPSGMENGHDGPGGMQNVSVETRAEFMQATHEGDYDTAMALHDEYGLGGKRMEFATPEILALSAEIFNAQTLGNWVEAVVFQDKLREVVAETMQAAMEERKGACDAAMEENADEIAELQEQIKTARKSGDEETARELQDQMKELVPEGCAGKGHGMMGQQGEKMPPETKEECKAALEENKDELASLNEQLKTAKEAGDEAAVEELNAQIGALIPEECPKGPHGKGMPMMGQETGGSPEEAD